MLFLIALTMHQHTISSVTPPLNSVNPSSVVERSGTGAKYYSTTLGRTVHVIGVSFLTLVLLLVVAKRLEFNMIQSIPTIYKILAIFMHGPFLHAS